MKIDEFITSVLCDIDAGLKRAKDKTNRNYHVDIHDYEGVTFDIAVTTTNANESQIEGTAKAGFVEVVGAKLGTKFEGREENSQVSRIQFSVYVPDRTDNEIKADAKRFRQQVKRSQELAIKGHKTTP